MLSLMRRIARVLMLEARRRRELRELLKKDDWTLRDIGLTRREIERALRRLQPANAGDQLTFDAQRLLAMRAPL